MIEKNKKNKNASEESVNLLGMSLLAIPRQEDHVASRKVALRAR